jgi:hypothetical protein
MIPMLNYAPVVTRSESDEAIPIVSR